MQNLPNTILWIYIVLLLLGGLFGYYRAKSQISLFMSVGFAVVLIICMIPKILDADFARNLSNVLLAILLVVFVLRWVRTKKFMPAGLMIVLTVATLALRNIKF